ncbi:hypothetical protein N658DRAFT_484776 [Parathielavia hyrcaniae]|uniref:Uncharacterized protein n=1 Tax=Parathielavia hyrcaniae TaxID=113614 RepID=A0AAN6T3Y5_9PEZI|nr:hypothetical protein N658DRAFT_484776 [Parathielavia hyrcaniae]
MTACGTACARTLNDNFKRHQRELKRKDKELEKRKKERLERAQAVAREYRKHKQKEEEALRRQKEEREQKQRAEREKERNGRRRQGAQAKLSMPSASGTNRSGSSISRSNARHVGRRQEGTLDDPRGSPPVQTVAAQKKPMPQHQQRPSMPANAELRPPVPPKDPRRPVPAKNNWQPQHPNLAPAPLALQTKPPGRAARAPAQQPPPPPSGPLNGVRRNFLELDDRLAGPKRTTPNRKPVPASNTAPPPRAAQQPPQQQQQVGGGRTPGYRPNPMFANNKKADAKKPAEVSAAKPENKKKNPWFKRLIAPSSEAVNLVEWVSEDAARVERGLVERPKSLRMGIVKYVKRNE